MRCRSIAQIGLFTINSRGGDQVEASPVEVSYLKDDGVFPYDLILDRISHEVPFYRTHWKCAAASGVRIVNAINAKGGDQVEASPVEVSYLKDDGDAST